LAFLTLVPFLRYAGLRRWSDLGLRPNPRGWRDVAAGSSWGTGGLGLLVMCLVLAGVSRPQVPLPWERLPALLLGALVVSLMEETLFRGALFGVLRRAMHWLPALVLLSAIFATLHFIDWKANTPRGAPVEWHTGLRLIGHMLHLSHPRVGLAGWPTFFVAGLVLGDCVRRTGSLHLAIGVHAGWVLGQRAFEVFFTRPVAGPWIGPRLTDGVAPLLGLLATWVLVRRWARDDRTPVGTGAAREVEARGH
jgi:membrane protease YdiL (CAAX protease family)